MPTRELTRPPHILPLYLRTAASLLPGAHVLPGVPGHGKSIPPLELTLRDVPIERERLAAYRAVCDFAHGRDLVAPTYPHILAFPLHMALMAEPAFPFSAVGLVHVENEIRQTRSLRVGERLNFLVHATPFEPHPRGRTFCLLTTARVGDELVWSERSTMLHRGAPWAGEGAPVDAAEDGAPEQAPTALSHDSDAALTRSRIGVPGDVGRRYAAVSGDRNPIHMHALGGKAFGFPRAIAHGMWTKARCLAALEAELPDALTVNVRFRRPVLIPASASFECESHEGTIRFMLRSESREQLHLAGSLHEGVAEGLAAASMERVR